MTDSTDRERTPAEARLLAHVEAILDRSATPASERSDLAEELYGGLLERWQAEVSAGADPDTAASRAIASFGRPDTIGSDLMRAYHSTLYASTIGVLLPAVAVRSDRPPGLGILVAFLALESVLAAIAVVFAPAVLSPTRAVTAMAISAAAAVVYGVAARALWKGQRWALPVCRFAVVAALVQWGMSLIPLTLHIDIGGLVALVAIFPAFGADVSGWVAASRPIGRRLGTAVALAIVLPLAFAPVASAVPELTAVGPGDLHLQATVTCSGTPLPASEAVITATVTWDRLDPLPFGASGADHEIDHIAVWLEGTPPVGETASEFLRSGRHYFQPTWAVSARLSGVQRGPIAENEPPFPTGDTLALPPGAAVGPGVGTSFAPHGLKSGVGLRAQWGGAALPLDLAGARRVIVAYDHLGRFGAMAVATPCAGPVDGAPAMPPYPLP